MHNVKLQAGTNAHNGTDVGVALSSQTIAKPNVGGSTVNKPKRPKEPLWEDFPTPILPNGINHLDQPLFQKLDWIEAYKKYEKELTKYKTDLETYEQTKLIRLLKNSTEKYCLKAFKIMKR